MRTVIFVLLIHSLVSFTTSDSLFAQKNTLTDLEKVIDRRNSELEKIQADLEGKKLKVKFLETEEKSHLEKLYALEERLNLNYRIIIKVKKQLEDLTEYLVELEIKLENSRQELIRREEILSERLVWIYKRSRIPKFLTALSAGDLLQGARRLYIFSLLNRYDRKMVKEIGSLNLQIKNEMAELTKRKKSVVALKNEKTTLVNNISRKRKQRKILLKEVKAQKDAEYRAIENLIADQNRISNIIEVLLTNRSALDKKAAKEFTKLRGKLIWPVQGKIIRKFGKIKDKKYNTVISNPGIDIKAMANAPVYASSTGMVAYVSWLRGYGSFIILDHGGGYYTLYAHLNDILVETNQFVAAGEKLATISETGTFSGPMLHFELRSGKEQLDPLPWLR